MEMNGLIFFLLVVLASGIGHLAGERFQRALDARQAAPDGYPAVVEREGVWWVYVHGQGWTETNPRATAAAMPDPGRRERSL